MCVAIAPARAGAKYCDTRPHLVRPDMTRDEGYGGPAIAGLALVIAGAAAVGGLCAGVPALSAYLQTRFAQEKPQLIRCAAIVSSEGSPCFPDPGFTRLGIPQPLPYTRPHTAPIAPFEAPPPPSP